MRNDRVSSYLDKHRPDGENIDGTVQVALFCAYLKKKMFLL